MSMNQPQAQDFPDELSYLMDLAHKYGGYLTEERLDALASSLSDTDIALLASTCERAAASGHLRLAREWHALPHRAEAVRKDARYLFELLCLFNKLATRGIHPFSLYINEFFPDNPAPSFDWSKLDSSMAYVIDAAEKYGQYCFDDDVEKAIQRLSEQERTELEILAHRIKMRGDAQLLSDWMDAYPITDHAESERIYFLLYFLDAMGLKFE